MFDLGLKSFDCEVSLSFLLFEIASYSFELLFVYGRGIGLAIIHQGDAFSQLLEGTLEVIYFFVFVLDFLVQFLELFLVGD